MISPSAWYLSLFYRRPCFYADIGLQHVRQVGILAQFLAAIDGETLAGHPGRFRSSQVTHRLPDIDRVTGTAQREFVEEFVEYLIVGEQIADPLAARQAG